MVGVWIGAKRELGKRGVAVKGSKSVLERERERGVG